MPQYMEILLQDSSKQKKIFMKISSIFIKENTIVKELKEDIMKLA